MLCLDITSLPNAPEKSSLFSSPSCLPHHRNLLGHGLPKYDQPIKTQQACPSSSLPRGVPVPLLLGLNYGPPSHGPAQLVVVDRQVHQTPATPPFKCGCLFPLEASSVLQEGNSSDHIP